MKQTTTLLAALLSTGVIANAQIISDNYNITGNGTGFLLGEGVNSGINPPDTRLVGTAAENLRYINRAGKVDTAYLIGGNTRMRVNSGSQSGRVTLSADGVNPFDFGVALGTGAATAANPIEYDVTISMDNNASGTHRMSFAIGSVESSAGDWDFGIQLHKTVGTDDFYTVSRRMDTASTGLAADANTPMLTMAAGTAGTELDFLIRITDAGAESSTFNSRVRVSLDGGANWFYDSATDSSLVNGWGFDGAERYFSWDIAGGNSSFVTYDSFSVSPVPEPATSALMVFGGIGAFWFYRRKSS